jgi:DNA polymerase-3 subunit epsilon
VQYSNRQVVLDTETTGLEPEQGHRIIEIGCVELGVELVDRRLTGNTFHQYLRPDREIDPGAVDVHGITNEFLADKPRFEGVAEDLLAYLSGAELIIHNAPFDVGFLDAELAAWGRKGGRGGLRIADICLVTDTLVMARRAHPGQRNSLDALCKRYGVDNSHRDLHGALLDAEILADVYLAMTGGQVSLSLEGAADQDDRTASASRIRRLPADRQSLAVRLAGEQELASHAARLDAIDRASGGHCRWSRGG